jgi:hypothetical protein
VVVVQLDLAKTHLMAAKAVGPGNELGEDARRIGIEIFVDKQRKSQYQKSKKDYQEQKTKKDLFHTIDYTRLSYQKMATYVFFGTCFNFRGAV